MYGGVQIYLARGVVLTSGYVTMAEDLLGRSVVLSWTKHVPAEERASLSQRTVVYINKYIKGLHVACIVSR